MVVTFRYFSVKHRNLQTRKKTFFHEVDRPLGVCIFTTFISCVPFLSKIVKNENFSLNILLGIKSKVS